MVYYGKCAVSFLHLRRHRGRYHLKTAGGGTGLDSGYGRKLVGDQSFVRCFFINNASVAARLLANAAAGACRFVRGANFFGLLVSQR